MIGLFCFDGPIYKDKDGIYCSVTLTNEMFNRYFDVVDKLVVIIRTFNINKSYTELNMKPLDLDKIKVIEVENINNIKGFIIGKRIFEKKIENTVKNSDMIFARMPSIISNSVLKVAIKLKKDYLVEVGGCAWDSYWNHGILGKIVAPIMYYNEKKYISNAKFATYVTKHFLQKRYPNSNDSINCSNVYLMPENDSILLERINKIKKMNFDKIILGQAVNSIDVKYKGEQLILKAMQKLINSGFNIEYQVVGPGNGEYLRKTAKKYGIQENLKLLGTKTKDEIFKWNKQIDIYVQPSKQEGLPRSVIEAMSMGCPCVGSNIAGIPELLDSDCLFNPNDNSDIVITLEKLIDKEKLLKNAYRNFNVAKEYQMKVINERRKLFFIKYKNYIANKTKV